jgi:hypothetical protein
MPLRPKSVRTKAAKLSVQEQVAMRWAIAVFLATIADGAVRKWLLPSSLQAIPYFAKDVVAGLFILVYRAPKEARWTRRLMPFVGGITLCLAPAFLLGLSKAPSGAIVVFKNAVLWPLFAICLGSYLTETVIERLWRFAVLCSIAMAAFSCLQYFTGAASVLNRYAWEDMTQLGSIAVAGDFVRATGTFSYISGLAAFSMVMFCAFFGRSISAKRGELWLAIAGLSSAVICGLTTGSRGIQAFMAVVATVVIVIVPKNHSVRLMGGIVGAGMIAAILWNSSLAQGVTERWTGTLDDEITGRLTGAITGQPIIETLAANPIGLGLGLYTGISALAGITADLPYNESASNRIAAETGVLGFMATALGLALIIRATGWTLSAQNAVRKSRVLPIAAGALIQLTLGLWYDHVATALWWWIIALWFGGTFNSAKRIQPLRRSIPSVPLELV